MISRHALIAIVQLLDSLNSDAASLLVEKHFGERPDYRLGMRGSLEVLERGTSDEQFALLHELVRNQRSVRASAPSKYVFDERFDELARAVALDGLLIDEGQLLRMNPTGSDVAEIQDALLSRLAASPIDADGQIRRLIDQSARDFTSTPPDFNGSGTNARVALETMVRRLAADRAAKRHESTPQDRWGPALAYLRTSSFLDAAEEQAFAALYTFVSNAAHVPLSDEEWARLARVYSLTSVSYLAKKAEVVP